MVRNMTYSGISLILLGKATVCTRHQKEEELDEVTM